MRSRKGIKIISIGIALILVVFFIISAVLFMSLDADLLESYIEKKFSREVTTKEIKLGLFSSISGIRAKQVAISNRWTEQKIENEEIIPEKSTFIQLNTLNFRFAILPLLKRSLIIRELILYDPEIRLIRYTDGSLNISDLISYNTLYAGDLPLSIIAKSIGVKNGTADLQDIMSGHRYSVQNLYLDFFDIHVDPNDLKNKNSLKTRMNFTLQSLLIPNDSFAEEVSAQFITQGNIQPFDLSTQIYDPSIHLNIETPAGKVSGFKLIKKIKDLRLLGEFGVKLDFLNDTLEWKKGSLTLHYAGGILEFKDGELKSEGYSMK
jgi:hypothetical protein